MTNHKYEIEKTPDGGYVLWIDGKHSICPFCPPVMLPGHMPGTASVMRMPCSTQCPMAETISKGDDSLSNSETRYVTICGSLTKARLVTLKGEPKQPSILKSL